MNSRPFEVLLVEDNRSDVEIIQEAFDDIKNEREPVRLSVATNGSIALARLRGSANIRPDLILMDINMPVKNGFEALREIKSDPDLKAIPVVILTTSNRPEDMTESYSAGASSYILKPLKFKDLRETLKRCLRYYDRTRNPANSGLTLIELLVVVAIIGVLSVAAISKIGEAINRTRHAALITYMVGDFRSAMRDYYFDKGAYPPGPGDPTVALKADGYIDVTFTDKAVALNLNLNSTYFSGTPLGGGLPLGGVPLGSSAYYSYRWCLLYPSLNGIKLPCTKVTESALEESDLPLSP